MNSPINEYVIKEASQAINNWNIATNTAHFPPSSFLIAAIAATQGVYSRQNISNEHAELMSRKLIRLFPGNNTSNVDTTDSFAMKPLIKDIAIFQFPNPQGLNIGAIIPAMEASIDSSLFAVIFNDQLKFSKNHIPIDAIKITVNALSRKSFALSHNN